MTRYWRSEWGPPPANWFTRSARSQRAAIAAREAAAAAREARWRANQEREAENRRIAAARSRKRERLAQMARVNKRIREMDNYETGVTDEQVVTAGEEYELGTILGNMPYEDQDVDMLEEVVAGAAGAALGFIAGDVPGAFTGASLAMDVVHNLHQNKNKMANNQHGGINVSKILVKRQNKKKIYGIGAPIKYKEQYSTMFTGSTGYQAVSGVSDIGTAKQFMSLSRTGAATNVPTNTNCAIRLLSLNPGGSTVGGSYYAADSTPADDKIILEHCRVNIQLTNFTNGACFGGFYVFRAKTNTQQAYNAVWDEAATMAGLGKSGQNDDNATKTVGTEFKFEVAATPCAYKSFRDIYELVAYKKVTLAGAAMEEVDFFLECNKLFKQGDFINDNPGLTTDEATWIDSTIVAGENYLRGSYQIVWIGHNQVTLGAEELAVHGSSKVGAVVRREWQLRAVKAQQNRVETLVAVNGVVGQTVQKIINTDDVGGAQVTLTS